MSARRKGFAFGSRGSESSESLPLSMSGAEIKPLPTWVRVVIPVLVVVAVCMLLFGTHHLLTSFNVVDGTVRIVSVEKTVGNSYYEQYWEDGERRIDTTPRREPDTFVAVERDGTRFASTTDRRLYDAWTNNQMDPVQVTGTVRCYKIICFRSPAEIVKIEQITPLSVPPPR